MISILPEYEEFIYSLQQRYPSIRSSTLVVKRSSTHSAQIVGTVYFDKDVTLSVLETIDFLDSEIVDYSYEVRQGSEKLYWYDSWPHPEITELASSHPHHKHIQPGIKDHRIPAPEVSFDKPNLPYLIHEVEELVLTLA